MSDEQSDQLALPEGEMKRAVTFIVIQAVFLAISPLTGGWHYKIWSMLDSAILVLSIGLTGLMFVIEGAKFRRLIFKVAVALYVMAVVDMSLNILLSGWLGWGEPR